MILWKVSWFCFINKMNLWKVSWFCFINKMNLWKVSLLVSLMKRFCEKFHLLGFINKTKQIFWHLTCPGPWAASRWRFVFLTSNWSSCFWRTNLQFHIINKIETWFVLFFLKHKNHDDNGWWFLCNNVSSDVDEGVCVC